MVNEREMEKDRDRGRMAKREGGEDRDKVKW